MAQRDLGGFQPELATYRRGVAVAQLVRVPMSKPVPLGVLRQAVQGLVQSSKVSSARLADLPRP